MKVFLDTVGCRLNQSEIEKLASQFRAAGHLIVENAAEADLVVVNTCTVTQEAAADSRAKIRRAARAGNAEIVATGCWATLEPDQAAKLPGVTRVYANERKEQLAGEVLGIDPEIFDLEPLDREPLPGMHLRTRAFIKAQDGCDNFCTFCVTRVARGKACSRPIEEILGDIRSATAGGVQEIVLTGVHLGSWGQDLPSKLRLQDLIQFILDSSSLQRLRLSSVEPWDLEESFFALWADKRLCRHFHLPLQSGSANTLKRMGRKTTPEKYSALLAIARQAVPQVAITTDVIVGFPGETDQDFEESLEFVRAQKFAGGHVFHFSPREQTAAARFAAPVNDKTCRQRSAAMRAVLAETGFGFEQQFIGSHVQVLWEANSSFSQAGWTLHGLTDHYLKVQAISPVNLWNQFNIVRLDSLSAHGFSGTILSGRE